MLETIVRLDEMILLWIQEDIRCDLLTPVFTFITHLGDHAFIWIALAVVFLLFKSTRKTGVLMGVSLLGSLLINNLLLKNLAARVRPYEAVEGLQRIIEAQSDLSFPSGHTGSSFAAAVVIFLMCPRSMGIPALVLAVLITLSRLYVGVHYPTDVLAGMITGTLIAMLVCAVFKRCLGWNRNKKFF